MFQATFTRARASSSQRVLPPGARGHGRAFSGHPGAQSGACAREPGGWSWGPSWVGQRRDRALQPKTREVSSKMFPPNKSQSEAGRGAGGGETRALDPLPKLPRRGRQAPQPLPNPPPLPGSRRPPGAAPSPSSCAPSPRPPGRVSQAPASSPGAASLLRRARPGSCSLSAPHLRPSRRPPEEARPSPARRGDPAETRLRGSGRGILATGPAPPPTPLALSGARSRQSPGGSWGARAGSAAGAGARRSCGEPSPEAPSDTDPAGEAGAPLTASSRLLHPQRLFPISVQL